MRRANPRKRVNKLGVVICGRWELDCLTFGQRAEVTKDKGMHMLSLYVHLLVQYGYAIMSMMG